MDTKVEIERSVKRFAKDLVLACIKSEPDLPRVPFPNMGLMDMHMIAWSGRPRKGGDCRVLTSLLIGQESQNIEVTGHCTLHGDDTGWISGTVEIQYPSPDGEKYQFQFQTGSDKLTVTLVRPTPAREVSSPEEG